jgi:plastocyanin domain-containing protein
MKVFVISLLMVGVFIGGIIFLLGGGGEKTTVNGQENSSNVFMIDGVQVVEITAKGLYAPKKTAAKANLPTVIKIKTDNTFDCSKSLNFPSLGLRKLLPSSGETLVELPEQKPGSTIKGVCSMGMYSFVVNFN